MKKIRILHNETIPFSPFLIQKLHLMNVLPQESAAFRYATMQRSADDNVVRSTTYERHLHS